MTLRRFVIEREISKVGYLTKDEAVIRKHAEISGFPANKITEISKVIDPTTAAGISTDRLRS